jgi:inorganic triphosphatase YgiF
VPVEEVGSTSEEALGRLDIVGTSLSLKCSSLSHAERGYLLDTKAAFSNSYYTHTKMCALFCTSSKEETINDVEEGSVFQIRL